MAEGSTCTFTYETTLTSVGGKAGDTVTCPNDDMTNTVQLFENGQTTVLGSDDACVNITIPAVGDPTFSKSVSPSSINSRA